MRAIEETHPRAWGRQLSEASITRIVARPDLPRPILLTETKQGAKAWLVKEVAEWLHQNQAKVPRGRQRSK